MRQLFSFLCTGTAIVLGIITWQCVVHFGDTSRFSEAFLQGLGIGLGSVVAFVLSRALNTAMLKR